LIQAYNQISRKKGANTVGVDDETLDGMSKETIRSLSQKLKDHSFRFKPIRRVYIPKKDGSLRPIGIPGPRDKVVQKAAANALEEIFEKEFLKCNHGFRANKGTHTALKEISGWTGVK